MSSSSDKPASVTTEWTTDDLMDLGGRGNLITSEESRSAVRNWLKMMNDAWEMPGGKLCAMPPCRHELRATGLDGREFCVDCGREVQFR